MTKKERREADRRPSDRREAQPDDEQQRHPGETEIQEGDSLTALKAILAKVAALLAPLKLTQDESTSLVEQLYGSVLEMDLKLAGEADDRRKSSVLAHIQNTKITRNDGRIVVEYPTAREPAKAQRAKSGANAKTPGPQQASAKSMPDKTEAVPDKTEAAPEPTSEPERQVAPTATPERPTEEKSDES